MYLDFKVKIPSDPTGITRKRIKGITYIYYAYEHKYDPEKGYTVPKSTSVGKCTDDELDMMYPNTSFLKFFPAEELPETKGEVYRSGCLRIGTYLVLRRIIWMKCLQIFSERTADCFWIWQCTRSLQRIMQDSIILIMHLIIHYSQTG